MDKHRFIDNNDNINRLVHLYFSEIQFDVEYGVLKRAKMAGLKDEQLQQFSFTDSDRDWLTRCINMALANIKSRISWALEQHSAVGNNELLSQPEEYILSFRLPSPDWRGDAQTLTDFVHSYITQFCIAGFLKMGGLESYAIVLNDADEMLRGIIAEVNKIVLSEPPIFRL